MVFSGVVHQLSTVCVSAAQMTQPLRAVCLKEKMWSTGQPSGTLWVGVRSITCAITPARPREMVIDFQRRKTVAHGQVNIQGSDVDVNKKLVPQHGRKQEVPKPPPSSEETEVLLSVQTSAQNFTWLCGSLRLALRYREGQLCPGMLIRLCGGGG